VTHKANQHAVDYPMKHRNVHTLQKYLVNPPIKVYPELVDLEKIVLDKPKTDQN
jgi:hypothetical protein